MKSGKFLRPLLRTLLVLLISAPIIVLLLAVQGSPTVSENSSLAPGEIAQIEQLIVNTTPQSPNAPGRHQIRFSEEELNLLLRYGSQALRLEPAWSARLQLSEDQVHSQLSLQILQSALPLYLNLEADFQVVNEQLVFANLTAGRLPIPDFLLQFTLEQIRSNLAIANVGFRDIDDFLATIHSVDVDETNVQIAMDWDPELLSQFSQHAQQMFVSEADQQRISAYYGEISLLAAAMPADLGAVSLNAFLAPLFRTAQERTLAGSDPIAENRTLLQALAIYVSDEEISQLLGDDYAPALPKAKFVEVRLHRRQDMARHLVSMAAITASAGAGIAEMLSTTKEAYDARYRSGFSFSDLAANTAGTLLASYATRDADTAILLQQRLANLSEESDYMPEVGNNRDGLSEDDFNALYADRSSPEYQERLAEIEELILARPLFFDLP